MKKRGEDLSVIKIRSDNGDTALPTKSEITGEELILLERATTAARAVRFRDAVENMEIPLSYYAEFYDGLEDVATLLGSDFRESKTEDTQSRTDDTSYVSVSKFTSDNYTVADLHHLKDDYVPNGNELILLDTGDTGATVSNNYTGVKAVPFVNAIEALRLSDNFIDNNTLSDEDVNMMSLFSNSFPVDVRIVDRLGPKSWVVRLRVYFPSDNVVNLFNLSTLSFGTTSLTTTSSSLCFKITKTLDYPSGSDDPVFYLNAFGSSSSYGLPICLNAAGGDINYIWYNYNINDTSGWIPIAKFKLSDFFSGRTLSSWRYTSDEEVSDYVVVTSVNSNTWGVTWKDMKWLDCQRSVKFAYTYKSSTVTAYQPSAGTTASSWTIKGYRILNPKLYHITRCDQSYGSNEYNSWVAVNGASITDSNYKTWENIYWEDDADSLYICLYLNSGSNYAISVLSTKLSITTAS